MSGEVKAFEALYPQAAVLASKYVRMPNIRYAYGTAGNSTSHPLQRLLVVALLSCAYRHSKLIDRNGRLSRHGGAPALSGTSYGYAGHTARALGTRD